MRRTNCTTCNCDDLEVFLDLGLSPVADAYTSEPDLSAEYPLQLAVCTDCRLVQLTEVLPQSTLFGTGYSFYTSASPPLSAYHREYAQQIWRDAGVQASKFTVEIGCNDGDMLRHFDQFGCKTLGVDPASGPVAVARERGLEVMRQPFTAELAREIVGAYGHAGVVIANHVLAHVESVASVLDGVANLLSHDGVAYVEVQYLPDLLVSNAFDLVYHEHRNFFSLRSLVNAARRVNLHVAEVQLTHRQGGSLRATLRHGAGSSDDVQRILRAESWLNHDGAFRGFQGRIERVRTRLLDLLHDEIDAGRTIIGYGAPAKATTLLNFCEVDTSLVSLVTDTTPAKQGRFMPGTCQGIVAPLSPGHVDPRQDTYLLLAWNYAREIIRHESEFTRAGGRWIIPIPVPTLF